MRWSIALFAAMFAGRSFAATFIVPDDRTLVAASRAIVIANAGESISRWSAGGLWIETVTRFDVVETIKGAPSGAIDVVELGGIVGDIGYAVAGSPRYERGERYLLFLDRTDRGEWTAKNMAVGAFVFRGDLVLRDADGICGWSSDGRAYREPRRRAQPFLEFVRAVLSGAPAAPPAYASTAAGAPPRAVTDASIGSYLIQSSGPSGTLGIRWSEFPSPVVLLSRGTQPGATNGGVTAAQRGISVWTSDPASNVVYQYGGTTSASGGLRSPDGVHAILFNDPGGEIPGAYTGRNGDTLAIGGAWFSTTPHSLGAERFYTIREADLVVQNGIFGAGLTGNGFDRLLAHELGHTLGFRHSDEPPGDGTSATNAIMNSTVNFNGDLSGAALQAWDREAVAAVYGAAASCAPPSIVAQPVSMELRNDPVVLSVTAAATGSVQYQWFIGTRGNTSRPVSGGNGPQLTVSPASTTPYWVRVSNGCNPPADSNTAFVIVNNCPGVVITRQEPLTTTIIEGRTTTLSVTAEGGTLTYQWYAGFSGDTSAPVPGANGATVEVRPSVTTRYWVEVKNSCGAFATGETITIFVQPCNAPRIAVQPSGGSAASGDVVTVAATLLGSEPMTMQWYEGAVGDRSRPMPNARASNVSVGPILAASSYWLQVENDCGSTSSQAASFTIVASCAAPAIVQQPRDVVVAPGMEAWLDIAASGTSLLYRWYEGPVFDFTRPAGASASSLYVAPSGAPRTFWARIQNNCGTVDSVAATVTPGTSRRRAAQ